MSDPYNKYMEGYREAVDRHRERSFQYEEKAIEFANNALRALTYLNGGALVAIPTAVALFQADVPKAKAYLIYAAFLFVVGLVCVVIAQGCAFFTMARRSESETFQQNQQINLLLLKYYASDHAMVDQATVAAEKAMDSSNSKIARSNYWRFGGLAFFWLSLLGFLSGCYFGAHAVLS